MKLSRRPCSPLWLQLSWVCSALVLSVIREYCSIIGQTLYPDYPVSSADTLYICYCIDKDTGERHREEVFDAVSSKRAFRCMC